jgi:hypothetical protein
MEHLYFSLLICVSHSLTDGTLLQFFQRNCSLWNFSTDGSLTETLTSMNDCILSTVVGVIVTTYASLSSILNIICKGERHDLVTYFHDSIKHTLRYKRLEFNQLVMVDLNYAIFNTKTFFHTLSPN